MVENWRRDVERRKRRRKDEVPTGLERSSQSGSTTRYKLSQSRLVIGRGIAQGWARLGISSTIGEFLPMEQINSAKNKDDAE